MPFSRKRHKTCARKLTNSTSEIVVGDRKNVLVGGMEIKAQLLDLFPCLEMPDTKLNWQFPILGRVPRFDRKLYSLLVRTCARSGDKSLTAIL